MLKVTRYEYICKALCILFNAMKNITPYPFVPAARINFNMLHLLWEAAV